MRLAALLAGLVGLPLLVVFGGSLFGPNGLKDPYRDLPWQDFAAGTRFHDQPARVKGFVLPFRQNTDSIAEFFLTPSPVRDLSAPLPPPEQLIWVRLESGELAPTPEPIVVWGLLESGRTDYEGIEVGHQLSAHGWETYHAPMPGDENRTQP